MVKFRTLVLKTSKNVMKHMILSFKMKGDVISDHFLGLGLSPRLYQVLLMAFLQSRDIEQ